ncbi:MAG: sulfite exporter TauE/SafE family protein [Gemmatimonadota bacterium]|nr:sulfite exporter TauE/SafE family protein [Gemmatimonadota bacterium]
MTYVAIGLIAGVFSGVFGIGGGVVIVPLLVFAAKMSQKVATGTSIGVFLLPVAFLGAMAHYRAGNVNVKASLLIAAGLFVGSWVGAQISLGMSDALLKRAFAVLLVAVAARLWWTA